jgi:hypothetical protein
MQGDDLEKNNGRGKENAFVRYGRAVFLILTMSINGFIIGAGFSAQFIVEGNSGLAGGAEVAVGGLVASILSFVISILMIQRLKGRVLFQITALSVLITLILIGVIALRV